MDGFQCGCLRRILHVPPAYVSRVPNKHVLAQAGQEPYTARLLKHELVSFGKVGRAAATDPLRRPTSQPGGLRPAADTCARAVGRPKQEWAKSLAGCVQRQLDTQEQVMACADDPVAWRKFVVVFVYSPPYLLLLHLRPPPPSTM